MVKRKKNQTSTQSKQAQPGNAAGTGPKFPYTTKPNSLRRLLQEIPKKPRPSKFDKTLLRSWGFTDTNDLTTLRVLKSVGLLNSSNEPTEVYSRFMNIDEGGKVLAPEIKRVYEPLFQASHTPYAESNEKLKNLFNIHSGGGESSLEQQAQTFKALCENASFDQTPIATGASSMGVSGQSGALSGSSSDGSHPQLR